MRATALTAIPRSVKSSCGRWLKAGIPVRRSESGTALIEFALVLPLLSMLALGAVDLGRAFRTYGQLKNAAREGAFYASTHPGYQTSLSYGFGSGSAGLCGDPNNVAFHAIGEGGHTDFVVTTTPSLGAGDCTDTPAGLTAGTNITVTVTKPNFPIISPIFRDLFGSLTLRSQITVRIAG